MEEEKNGKIAALIITLVVISIFAFGTKQYIDVGIFRNCTDMGRITYPFYHTNIVHLSVNVWALLSVVFLYHISLERLICAYIVAISIPETLLSTTPTIGLSGIIYMLFSSISFQVEKKTFYQVSMGIYLFISFILPNTNGWVHLYCYFIGIIYALLNKPIKV